MIKEDTVFILGAGASWHYGYPTGERLVKKVISKLEMLAESCRVSSIAGDALYNEAPPEFIKSFIDNTVSVSVKEQRELAWRRTAEACEAFANRLKVVNPPVIDYYISQQKEPSRALGELAIAWVILDCERESQKAHGNVNRRERLQLSPNRTERDSAPSLDLSKYADKWHELILYQLSVGCEKSSDIRNNKVHFITFNYDISLEYHLYNGLSANDLFESVDVKEFLEKDRFFHVYGQIKDNPLKEAYGEFSPDMLCNSLHPSENPRPEQRRSQFKYNADYAYKASKGIRTIASINGKQNFIDETIIKTAREKIANAKRVYVLGYGFDKNNNTLLGLAEHCKIRTSLSAQTQKKIMFTNFGNINRVNKMASKIFSPSGSSDYFMESNILDLSSSGVGGLSDYFEKSTNDVYSALSCDFDFLNE